MNNKYKILMSTLICSIFSAIIAAVFIIIKFEKQHETRIALLIIMCVVLAITTIVILTIWLVAKKQRAGIKKSFELYMEELISNVGVGTIMFNSNGVIIWTSKFIDERFDGTLMGKNIIDISEDFTQKLHFGLTNFIFESKDLFYETTIVKDTNSIIIKDVSEKIRIKEQYINERVVLGEVDIDNFQEYLSTLPEEEIFAVQATIMKMLDKLVEKYSIIYRQYVSGKFLIITNFDTLSKLISNRFNIFTSLGKNTKVNGIELTISAGFGVGSTVMSELMKLAKDAVSQSQSRGGNQVTVSDNVFGYKYYGAKTEVTTKSSRVPISKISKLFFNKLNDNSIKTVLVYGHKMADLDALGASYAIYEQAKNAGKKVFIVGNTFDNSTKKAIKKFIPCPKDVFIKVTAADKITTKSTMVVICDVADPSRTENNDALQGVLPENIFIFDHHRVSELPEGVIKEQTYIVASVSSASEIITEVIQFSNLNIKPSVTSAQLLLAGIYLDTNIFQKSVSSRTFSAASWLESYGAKARDVSDLLKFSEEQTLLIKNILTKLQEVKKGYYIASYDGDADSDVVAQATDEILRTQDRVAAFVIAKVPGKKLFKLSARSMNVNVQIIAEKVGGGGHFSSAAAISNESLDVFKDNVIQAIVGTKDESNNNKKM